MAVTATFPQLPKVLEEQQAERHQQIFLNGRSRGLALASAFSLLGLSLSALRLSRLIKGRPGEQMLRPCCGVAGPRAPGEPRSRGRSGVVVTGKEMVKWRGRKEGREKIEREERVESSGEERGRERELLGSRTF